MIKFNSISKKFSNNNEIVNALHDVSFNINSKDIFGIVGKSGSGKSTLLKIMTLQMNPDSGYIEILNEQPNLNNKKQSIEILKKISVVHQGFSLLYNKSIIENIELPLILNKISKKVRRQLAFEMLKFVGLESKANMYPITLSGGEAQRIAIARALVSRPEIVIFDEPTSALDDETSVEILKLIEHVHKTLGTTIVLVSHQIHVIKYLCNKVLLLDDGKVLRIDEIKNERDRSYKYEDLLWGNKNDI